jgi:hypothetical protein
MDDRPAVGYMFKLLERYRDEGWDSFPEDECTTRDNVCCPDCQARYLDDDGRVIELVTRHGTPYLPKSINKGDPLNRDIVDRVDKYLEEHPDAKWPEIHMNVENAYATPISLQASYGKKKARHARLEETAHALAGN